MSWEVVVEVVLVVEDRDDGPTRHSFGRVVGP